MGFLDNLKVRKALTMHQRGNLQGAREAYEALYQAGILKPSYLLPFSVLLLRDGGDDNYQRVKSMLAKIQKSPELTPESRSQLLMNFAIADWKLGNQEKAIQLLEAAHHERPCGMIYQTLGYLYVEHGDAEKALAYNTEALDYDDEDAVTLDNLGQLHYRLLNDKAQAKAYFEQAHAIRPAQIDTLWFLSRYDLEEGNTEAAMEKLESAAEGRFSPLNYVTQESVSQEIERLKQDA